MTWWQSYWDKLTNPAWLADLTQSLVGAGLALVGAVVILRMQLKHDRRLLADQLKADRSATVAQQRAAAAEQLGRVLIQAADITDYWTGQDWFWRITREDSRALRQEAPGVEEIRNAEATSRVVLADLDSAPQKLWIERSNLWRALNLALHAVQKEEGPEPFTAVEVSLAGDTLMNENKVRIRQLGIALCRWDGERAMPGLDQFESWVPAARPDLDRLTTEAIEEMKKMRRKYRKPSHVQSRGSRMTHKPESRPRNPGTLPHQEPSRTAATGN